MKKELKEAIDRWFEIDKNPITRKEAERLAEKNDMLELEDRFLSKLSFGTAGLRGPMGAGFSRMNDVTVIQATQGLCCHLEKKFDSSVHVRGVVIGYDHRTNSAHFARLASAVFLARKIKVFLFKQIVFTPLVAFAVTKLNACAGVMVTASHNPKQDNGYKVYWENGAQIISPHDKDIAALMLENAIPWTWDTELCERSSICSDPMEEICSAYYDLLFKLCRHEALNSSSHLRIVYTPMHGVGLSFAERAFKTFNLPPFTPVLQQMHPHPDFPTVKYPNPEEGEGALRLAIQTANEHQCSLIFANDPDADRFAAAERISATEFHIFSGNQLGILLADYLWNEFKKTNCNEKAFMLNSAVSSRMLKAMAEKEKFQYEETLSGFKWIGNRVLELQTQGLKFVFAFEEAIGFMCSKDILEKDGIVTLSIFGEMSAQLISRGKTLLKRLDELYDKYGYFITNNSYFLCHSPETIRRIFNQIRFDEDQDKLPRREQIFWHNGKKFKVNYPTKIDCFDIEHIRDLTIGYDSQHKDFNCILPVSSTSQMITFYFKNGAIVTLRTSGTEPKIKYYIEVCGDAQKKQTIHESLGLLTKAVISYLLRPADNKLEARD